MNPENCSCRKEWRQKQKVFSRNIWTLSNLKRKIALLLSGKQLLYKTQRLYFIKIKQIVYLIFQILWLLVRKGTMAVSKDGIHIRSMFQNLTGSWKRDKEKQTKNFDQPRYPEILKAKSIFDSFNEKTAAYFPNPRANRIPVCIFERLAGKLWKQYTWSY